VLEKPDLQDELLKTRLSDAYGLRVALLAFLPLGADVNTAVYRVEAGDNNAQGRAYFLKLRRGPLDEMSVAVPAFLAGQDIQQIIAPIRTGTGQLWSRLEPFTMTLYPFVPGVNGYEVDLSEQQWAELGAALQRIHTASLPAWLRRALPRETYSARYRERVGSFQARLRDSSFADPIAAGLAAILQARAAVIRQLVEGARRLGRLLQSRSQDFRLCHADIHNGNILVGQDGSLHIVDWDTALLAPIERDLMFVGSGIGRAGNQPQELEWFYQGYGPTEIDPVALAYYRCERIVQDIDAFCEQILSTTEASEDRSQALRYLASQFQPNAVVEIALQSFAAVEALPGPQP
jgi:spectinomycin phosphotransferase